MERGADPATYSLSRLSDPTTTFYSYKRHGDDRERVIEADLEKRTSVKYACSTEGDRRADECGIQDRQSFLALVALLIFCSAWCNSPYR
jgi:hypothetical protein